MSGQPTHVGRFAPSPTGPLHFGSMVAAIGSYLDAHAHGGLWRLRIDDLDPPREQAGAADSILRTLDAFGLGWDGPVVWQSRRDEAYAAAITQLDRAGLLFPCGCTRREIGAGPYPGTCRDGLPAGRRRRSIRVRVAGAVVEFGDALLGPISQDLERDIGDFPVVRADGLYAYHLACVVDDFAQGITDVVRGADLLDCTARQIYLAGLLGQPLPAYAHLPLAVHPDGAKLSKQTRAEPVRAASAAAVTIEVLGFLGQDTTGLTPGQPPAELLDAAVSRWDRGRIPRGHYAVETAARDDGISSGV